MAIITMLNKTYPKFKKANSNDNKYTLGIIKVYNIIVIYLVTGSIEKILLLPS